MPITAKLRPGTWWLLAALVVVSPANASNGPGAWAPVAPWRLIAIHAVLMPDGRVLSFGTDGDGTQTGLHIYDTWDPLAGLNGGHQTLPNGHDWTRSPRTSPGCAGRGAYATVSSSRGIPRCRCSSDSGCGHRSP